MKTSLCRKGCCNVKWCPLLTSWASTIHKFQGFEAGFDKSDMFKYLICDPGDLKWEQDCPGALYVALSRAKTMGEFLPGHKFTRKSAIYWSGQGMTKTRIMEGSMKKGPRPGSPKVACELVVKRERWVKYLQRLCDATPVRHFTKKQMKFMRTERYTQGVVTDCITTMIQEPNTTWSALKDSKYRLPTDYFGNCG